MYSEFRRYVILDSIASGSRFTQRATASQLGIALGLVNGLVKALVAQGHVSRLANGNGKASRYGLTRKGKAELSRLSTENLEWKAGMYREARETVRARLAALVSERVERVVIYGADEIGEILLAALQGSGIEPVAVVDYERIGDTLFGFLVADPSCLSSSTDDGRRYDRIVVASFRHGPSIKRRLCKCLGIAPGNVVCL